MCAIEMGASQNEGAWRRHFCVGRGKQRDCRVRKRCTQMRRARITPERVWRRSRDTARGSSSSPRNGIAFEHHCSEAWRGAAQRCRRLWNCIGSVIALWHRVTGEMPRHCCHGCADANIALRRCALVVCPRRYAAPVPVRLPAANVHRKGSENRHWDQKGFSFCLVHTPATQFPSVEVPSNS